MSDPGLDDIGQTIKARLSAIDERLDKLVAQRTAISDEIRALRKERVPVQRLARAASPRQPRSKTAVLGVAEPPQEG